MSLASKVFGTENEFFDKTGKPIYMDRNYFKSLHYKFINERQRMKRKKELCVIPGCGKQCVASHTIPKSSVLKRVSHHKNVVYPKYKSSADDATFWSDYPWLKIAVISQKFEEWHDLGFLDYSLGIKFPYLLD